jgi:hypothetical protein
MMDSLRGNQLVDEGYVRIVIEAPSIAATWAFVLRHSSDFQGWRRKLGVSALVFPTVAVALDLMGTVSDHLSDSFAVGLWGFSMTGTLVMCLCGLTFAIFGRGSFRIAAIVWSLWFLAVVYFKMAAGM